MEILRSANWEEFEANCLRAREGQLVASPPLVTPGEIMQRYQTGVRGAVARLTFREGSELTRGDWLLLFSLGLQVANTALWAWTFL